MRDMPGQLIDDGHQEHGHVGEESLSVPNKLMLQNNHNLTTRLVGVALAKEAQPINADYLHVFGSVLLDNLDISADVLRRLICKQIPILPSSFSFLTKQGWPLSKHQECKVPLKSVMKEDQVIMIRKQHEMQRVGIMRTNGDTLGFVFIEFHWNITQVRDTVCDQLIDTKKVEFKFLDNNGWPVALKQESSLSVLDIISSGSQICIQCWEKPNTMDLSRIPRELPMSTPLQTRTTKGILFNKKSKKSGRNKWPSLIKRDNLVAKPILISYVRQEAAEHALNLKTQLESQGHSVYLDVHEIKTGCDWQDALNFAVSNCQVFVPLITPMYGKTQWTNREVKLADVLKKNIIPISFLDQWPPSCLAIQFASTQYIYWKPPDLEHGKLEVEYRTSDFRVWDNIYVKRVCKELEERCKAMMKKPIDNEKHNDRTVLDEARSASIRDINPNLVVISAHPKQKVLIHQLKVILENEGYDVWCSADLHDYQEPYIVDDYIIPSNANTPRELTSIPEAYSVFRQTYHDIAATIADSKRGSTQKNDADSFSDKKQLSRMISQASDISQVSSLTPERMERVRTFQQKADMAGVVIVIVSEAYTKSNTSQMQVFYCEHRKQVVVVKFDQQQLPTWFTMLMRHDMVTNVSNPQFIATLKSQLKRALNPLSSETPKDAASESKIQCLVNHIKKNVPHPETCVYIAGSSKLQSSRSIAIAKAIGRELAKVRNITLCTGGFFGAPDIVARTFYEAVQNNRDILTDNTKEPLVHLLPFKDTKDFTIKARQNPDGSFEAVPYGKTYYSGDSVKERETAVARLFDTCIVIEGGTGAAHEVEEFIWNDHFVIPVISTGGAAGGQYGVPLKIFEAPPCVSESDWYVLSDKEADPEDVAQVVVNIVIALKQSIVTHINSQDNLKCKTRLKAKKSKMLTKQDSSRIVLKKDEMVQTQNDINTDGHKLLTRQIATYSISKYKKGNRWQRFIRLFTSI